MPISVTVEVKNDRQAIGMMEGIYRSVTDKSEQQKGISRAVVALVEQYRTNFQTEGRMSGRRWRGLADRTLEDRARQGYGPGPILDRSGALRRAATFESQDLSRPASATYHDPYGDTVIRNRLTFRRDEATIILDGEKVANHHGSGADNLPARPIWYVTSRTDAAVRDAIAEWVIDTVLDQHSISMQRYGRS